MKKLIPVILYLFLLTSDTAQNSMSFYYVHALPQGLYQDHLEHQPSGIAIEIMRNIKKVNRLQGGLMFNIAMYQNENYAGQSYASIFERAYVETNEDDCYYIYQGVLRYFLNDTKAAITPYLQLQAGGTTFFSNLTVSETPDDFLESETRHHGTTWLAGLTAGTLVYINEAISAQVSVGYNFSGDVEYRASPELENLALYRVNLKDHMEESSVDHINLQAGFFMQF